MWQANYLSQPLKLIFYSNLQIMYAQPQFKYVEYSGLDNVGGEWVAFSC